MGNIILDAMAETHPMDEHVDRYFASTIEEQNDILVRLVRSWNKPTMNMMMLMRIHHRDKDNRAHTYLTEVVYPALEKLHNKPNTEQTHDNDNSTNNDLQRPI